MGTSLMPRRATRIANVLLGILVVSCASRAARAPAVGSARKSPYWEPGDRAKVMVGPDWIDVRFPTLHPMNVGCVPDADRRERTYYWSFELGYPGEARWGGHSAKVDVRFILPDSLPATDPRIDSALTAFHPIVEESLESQVTIKRTVPTIAWARLERGSLHVHIEGDAALRELRRPKRDTLALFWCQRDRRVGYTSVPLVAR